jgi:hypothetical protein
MVEQEQDLTHSRWRQLAAEFGWTRSSYYLMSSFLATLLLLGYVWWPLAADYLALIDRGQPIWPQLDWLLIGIFFAMSLLITAGADLKTDSWILFVGLAGGLVIESWGTQTELWTYYTQERPPLWIIPAWPIASLSIDRLVRLLDHLTSPLPDHTWRIIYWVVFPAFLTLLFSFVWPTRTQSLTVMALVLCTFLTASPTDHRLALLTFAAGTGLGYFLERWGTTRLCWTYYTQETPPLFAVLAHGMAAVAFWRVALLLKIMAGRLRTQLADVKRTPQSQTEAN